MKTWIEFTYMARPKATSGRYEVVLLMQGFRKPVLTRYWDQSHNLVEVTEADKACHEFARHLTLKGARNPTRREILRSVQNDERNNIPGSKRKYVFIPVASTRSYGGYKKVTILLFDRTNPPREARRRIKPQDLEQ